MSEHLRRGVLLRLAIAALRLAIPAAWAAGRIRAISRRVRYGRPGRHGPGLPEDGEKLTCEEAGALGAIDAGWKHTARPERSRT